MNNLPNDIKETIRIALAEDLGDGDITSELIRRLNQPPWLFQQEWLRL